MKKFYLLLLVCFCFSTTNNAQNLSDAAKPWGIRGINITTGLDLNTFRSMSHGQLMGLAKNPSELSMDLSQLTEESSVQTGGASLSLGLVISEGQPTANIQTTFQTALVLNSEKEAMVTFKNEDLDTSVVFCNLQSEVALEGSYLLTGKWGNRWIWTLGVGANIGTTFANQMILMEGEYFEPEQHPTNQEVSMGEPEVFDAKSVAYTRVFIPLGIHYQLTPGWTIGLNFRKGYGWQHVEDQGTNFIRSNIGMALGMGFAL